jgi:tripartite-type tricarboxylate transporter receptor subunit TctC
MIRRRDLIKGAGALAGAAALAPAIAPGIAFGNTKGGPQVRLVVPYGPGGSTDTSARVLAERLQEELGQQFLVDNKPGGGTMVGMQSVANSKPDGTTLLLTTTTAALLPAFDVPLPMHPQKDLAMVAQVADIPCLFAINPKVPAQNWAEFAEWAKQQPAEVPFSTSSAGGLPHLWGELISSKIGRKLQHVPYKAAAEALRDAVAGHVPAFVDVTTPIDQQIRAGTMRGLLVATAARVAATPDVPTVVELGMPDLQAAVYFGVSAPAGTPRPVIDRFNAAINAALKHPPVREKLQKFGYIITGGTPDAYTQRLAQETVRWRQVIKDAKIPAPI